MCKIMHPGERNMPRNYSKTHGLEARPAHSLAHFLPADQLGHMELDGTTRTPVTGA